MTHPWHEIINESVQAGFRACDLNLTSLPIEWSQFMDEALPSSLEVFAHLWMQHAASTWDILTQSVAQGFPNVTNPWMEALVEPLRSMLNRTEQAAIVFGHPPHWTSPDQWGCLLQIHHAQHGERYAPILLHPPASEREMEQAEHVLNCELPPSYRQFLALTNGLGFGATEDTFVCGVGPKRAEWTPVLLNQWLECQAHHEITASWRTFLGMYAYEHIMDRERHENTFRSDETVLIPFALTFETWCFDRTRRDSNGEYPIVRWDHELRKAVPVYATFGAWLAEEGEPYLFGDT